MCFQPFVSVQEELVVVKSRFLVLYSAVKFLEDFSPYQGIVVCLLIKL